MCVVSRFIICVVVILTNVCIISEFCVGGQRLPCFSRHASRWGPRCNLEPTFTMVMVVVFAHICRRHAKSNWCVVFNHTVLQHVAGMASGFNGCVAQARCGCCGVASFRLQPRRTCLPAARLPLAVWVDCLFWLVVHQSTLNMPMVGHHPSATQRDIEEALHASQPTAPASSGSDRWFNGTPSSSARSIS